MDTKIIGREVSIFLGAFLKTLAPIVCKLISFESLGDVVREKYQIFQV